MDHHPRYVMLPSGKTLEVKYPADGYSNAAPAVPPDPPQAPSQQLHICEHCYSHLVYPTVWDEASLTHWSVALRCPNCEWEYTGIFEQELVERFDVELDRGTEELVRGLKRLAHANMEDEIERFCLALYEGHIVPEDF